MHWKIVINTKGYSDREIVELLILMVNSFKTTSIQEFKDKEEGKHYFQFYTTLPKLVKNELERDCLEKRHAYHIFEHI